jgi:hypothetical protein
LKGQKGEEWIGVDEKYSQADAALKKRGGIIVFDVKLVDGLITSSVLH